MMMMTTTTTTMTKTTTRRRHDDDDDDDSDDDEGFGDGDGDGDDNDDNNELSVDCPLFLLHPSSDSERLGTKKTLVILSPPLAYALIHSRLGSSRACYTDNYEENKRLLAV